MTHGPLMLDLHGPALDDEERALLRQPAVGGVILFERNYRDPQQLSALVAEIHALRSPPLLVAVDQEGGRVQRFREGFTELPPVARLGDLYRRNPHRALEAAHHLGWLMAAELRVCGVDFSFAPVLDLQDPVSRIIGERAFSPDPHAVGQLGFAWRRGALHAGMASVGKHFPGHGRVAEDSHHELPVDPRPFEQLWDHDLVPFRHLADHLIEGFMPAHVVYSACDRLPAGYSAFWIGEVLRRRMRFQGVVFSDDLSMAAARVEGGPVARARAALEAGCDMILLCNDRPAACEVAEALAEHLDPVAQARLARMHGRGRPAADSVREDPRHARALEFIQRLATDPSLELNL